MHSGPAKWALWFVNDEVTQAEWQGKKYKMFQWNKPNI